MAWSRRNSEFSEKELLRPRWRKIQWVIATFFLAVCFLGLVWCNQERRTLVKYWTEDLFIARGNMNLMIGSSTIARLQPKKHLGCDDWLNRGIGHAKIHTLKVYLRYSFLMADPEILLLYAGENDLASGAPVEKAFSEYCDLIIQLHQKFPNAELHIVAIKPSPKRRLYWRHFDKTNEAIERFTLTMPDVFFHRPDWHSLADADAPLFDADGIHLTDDGYRRFTDAIRPLCQKQ